MYIKEFATPYNIDAKTHYDFQSKLKYDLGVSFRTYPLFRLNEISTENMILVYDDNYEYLFYEMRTNDDALRLRTNDHDGVAWYTVHDVHEDVNRFNGHDMPFI